MVTTDGPPEEFSERDLAEFSHTYPAGTSLFRVQECEHDDPLYFGVNDASRFDVPDQSIGVCYVAEHVAGAFAETAGPQITSHHALSEAFLEGNCLIKVEFHVDLTVLDLHGPNLLGLGSDSSFTKESDYTVARQWSNAAYHHPEGLHGIRWTARYNDEEFSVGLFERCDEPEHFSAEKVGPLNDESCRCLLEAMRETYGFHIL